jgi:hypothetical protein
MPDIALKLKQETRHEPTDGAGERLVAGNDPDEARPTAGSAAFCDREG